MTDYFDSSAPKFKDKPSRTSSQNQPKSTVTFNKKNLIWSPPTLPEPQLSFASAPTA